MVHAGGRPNIWKDPNDLQKLIDSYFKDNLKPTLSGLALFIGVDRKTLFNYSKKNKFFPTIKKAKAQIETLYEERLIYGDKPVGVIFALKNMDWRDKTETDITSGGKPLPPRFLGGQAKESV